MKLIFKMLLVLGFIPFLNAQSGINYKALIKDVNGNVISSSPISIQFIIYAGDALTNNVYQESHTINTDANGFIIVNIGEGATGDNFGSVNWGTDEHFLNVQVNIGSGLIDLGTTQFMAVPYALNASNVSGLEKIAEVDGQGVSNTGWRLKERDSTYYGPIGNNAVDFSYSNFFSASIGATGSFSTALGFYTEATGDYSTAMGRYTEALGMYSTAMGSYTDAEGDYSIAMGQLTKATANNSTAMGYSTEATEIYSTAIGYYTEATGRSSTAMGENTHATGISSTAIGNNTVALGDYSTSMGYYTEATGVFSTAMGRYTEAIGDTSIAMGTYTDAEGDYSTAMGQLTKAIGVSSTAMGYQTEATGLSSTAMGRFTEAIGDFSTTMGFQTNAPSFAETVVGLWNTSYEPNSATEWNPNDRAFVVGVGSGISFPRNAMTVLKSGSIGIGTDNPEALLHLEGILRIGTETIEDTGFNRLSFDASLLPNVNNDTNLGSTDFRWNTVYATNGTINTSDRREKKNIEDLNYGLAEVLQMQPVSFNWKSQDNPDLKLGLIAQDLQALIPEVVKSHTWETDKETGQLTKKGLERLGVYYSDLVPVLIKAIQEQNKIIQSQSDELKASSKNYKALLSRVEQLESKSLN